MTEMQRLVGIVAISRRTFAEMQANPSWLVPFLLILLVPYVLNFVVYRVVVTHSNFDQVARAKVVWDAAETRRQVTPDEINQGVHALRKQRAQSYLFPIIGITISTLGIAALF